MTARAAYLLFRVDDRLLHGQVALAWGQRLRPRRFLLADDKLAADPESARLYAFSAPEGCAVEVVPVGALCQETSRPPGEEGGRREAASSTVLLVRGLPQAARLLRAGIPGPLNLGGLHARPGAWEVFPYLFLTAEDESLLGDLVREGHAIFAQDLPQNPRREARCWLGGAGAGRD